MPKFIKLPFLFLLACVGFAVHFIVYALALALLPFDLAFAWSRGRCVYCHTYRYRAVHKLPFRAERIVFRIDDALCRNAVSLLTLTNAAYLLFGRYIFGRSGEHFTPPFAPFYRNCRTDSCRVSPAKRAERRRIAEQEQANALTPEEAYAERLYAEARATDDAFIRRVSNGTW